VQSQRRQRDAAVNVDTHRILQRHGATFWAYVRKNNSSFSSFSAYVVSPYNIHEKVWRLGLGFTPLFG